MIKAVFIDDSREYLDCIQEYMEKSYKDSDISFKTYLMRNKRDDERIEKEVLQERPQFIFCDMAMPYCDGGTLIRKLTKVYKPITVLISAIPDIEIHKDEFDYLLKKQPNLETLKNAIDVIIKSFELEEEITIDEILATEFPQLNYNERRYLRKIVRKFRDVKDPKQIKTGDVSKATNKEIHTTIDRINRFIKKLFKKKIDRDLFVFELLKVVYKRGFPDDKYNGK